VAVEVGIDCVGVWLGGKGTKMIVGGGEHPTNITSRINKLINCPKTCLLVNMIQRKFRVPSKLCLETFFEQSAWRTFPTGASAVQIFQISR